MVVHETYRDAAGDWVAPAEVAHRGRRRHARARRASRPARRSRSAPIEKMSKSKKNVVDPDDIIATYGADTARWFMLSDSPPERDVIWTEAGVEGAHRFVQRVWRLVVRSGAAARRRRRPRAAGDGDARRDLAGRAQDADRRSARTSSGCASTRRSRTSTSWSTRCRRRSARSPTARPIAALRRRCARRVEILVQLIAPMMPHLAEECWAALGGDGLVAERPWPVVDPALLVDNEITCPVQVNGKKRGDLTIARDADQAAVEKAALALDVVQKALEGKPPRKVIVVPQRIVNVVA